MISKFPLLHAPSPLHVIRWRLFTENEEELIKMIDKYKQAQKFRNLGQVFWAETFSNIRYEKES